MNWKEFKESKEVIDDEGNTTQEEETTKYLCKQDWLNNCLYTIQKTSYGWRGSFNFRESEEYIHAHQDLERPRTS